MKAITLKTTGGVENFVFNEVAVPVQKENEVLVKVQAISVNPVDAIVRSNESILRSILKLQNGEQDYILGWDISGEVVEKGSSVTKFNVGDEVFGMVHFPGYGKAYAEYVAVPADQIALKPGNVSHQEAAAATLAALTAWQALVPFGKIKENDKVLIDAAGGGVGHYAIQIAKHFGAYVIGIASGSKREIVLDLGADRHIDYEKIKFEEQVNDADFVLMAHGTDDYTLRAIDAVKTGGKVATLVGSFDDAEIQKKIHTKKLQVKRIGVVSNGEDMKAIAKLMENRELKSHISAVFSFNEMAKAHEAVSSGKTAGKIVISLQN